MSIEITQSIIDAQEHAGIDVSRFTRQDFLNSYYSRQAVSQSVFENRKNEMQTYLISIGADKALSELSTISRKDINYSKTYDKEYFADFDDFYDSLMQRVNSLSINSHDSIYDMQVASLILAWVGVLSEDAPDIKKSGLNTRLNVLAVNDKTYAVPQKAMDILIAYANKTRIVKYNGRGLCEMPLKEGPYLLRTNKSEKVSAYAVYAGVSIKLNVADGKKFLYNNVRLSGVFSRVFEHEQQYGEIEDIPWGYDSEEKTSYISKLEELFEIEGLSQKTLRERMTQYRAWKDHFHGK